MQGGNLNSEKDPHGDSNNGVLLCLWLGSKVFSLLRVESLGFKVHGGFRVLAVVPFVICLEVVDAGL